MFRDPFHGRGQAEKEFQAEVEAIGHVRHKNLVRLLGYCIEGTHRYCSDSDDHVYSFLGARICFSSVIDSTVSFRMLVYEYVNNGNLEQWLHGAMRQHGYLTWEARIKVLGGTAKA